MQNDLIMAFYAKTLLQMDKTCYVANVTHHKYKMCADVCKSQTQWLDVSLAGGLGALGALGSRYGSKALKNGSMFPVFHTTRSCVCSPLRQLMFVPFLVPVGRHTGAYLGAGELQLNLCVLI